MWFDAPLQIHPRATTKNTGYEKNTIQYVDLDTHKNQYYHSSCRRKVSLTPLGMMLASLKCCLGSSIKGKKEGIQFTFGEEPLSTNIRQVETENGITGIRPAWAMPPLAPDDSLLFFGKIWRDRLPF
ncbi:MAG: hypothetical protein CSA33_01430 [Desulfobulbus propionicus]|nr:MAG: hypothetical protein CSA33_01430 [Desulfobulbus propionicus]